MQVIDNAFNDVKNTPFTDPTGSIYGTQDLGSIAQAQIGFGTQVFRADQSGIWLGAKTFAAAPFKVDMEGNATAESITVYGESGQTVIDGNGVRSSSAFERDTFVSGSTITTTSTSYVDVTGSGFTVTTLPGHDVIIQFTIAARMSMGLYDFKTNGYYGEMILYDSFLAGTAIGVLSSVGIPTTDFTTNGSGEVDSRTDSTFPEFVSLTVALTVQAGTHNYKLQMRTVGGGTLTLTGFIIQTTVLGS